VTGLLALAMVPGLLEIGVRLLALDETILSKSLYWQTSDLDLYRPSDDPVLLYEARPGASKVGDLPGGRAFTASIDAHGARRNGASEREAPGTLPRLFFFGASTLFGAGVSDHETLAAALERTLAERGEPAEVWNFGVSGYTAGQMIHHARVRLREHARVDLLLVMPTNQGRRPFLGEPGAPAADPMPYFRADPCLYAENFPPPDGMPLALHEAAMPRSALYRFAIGSFRVRNPVFLGDALVADQLTRREALALLTEAEARNVPLYWVFYPRRGGGSAPHLPFDAPPNRVLDLQQPSEDPNFYEIHPPAPILAAHASRLAALLAERKLPRPH
jgi:hypothetical protein